MAKKGNVINEAVIRNGGATSPTIEFYQIESGYCRLWWYCLGPEGSDCGTIRAWYSPTDEKGRQAALNKATRLAQAEIDRARATRPMPLAEALRFLQDEVLKPFKESSLYDDYKNESLEVGFTDEKYEAALAAINQYLGR